MTHHATTTSPRAIDVLRHECSTARVSTVLPLALIEELDRARGSLRRSTYLAQVIDTLASRRYRQHVRSLELAADARHRSTRQSAS
jgi:membrane protein YdbS with pleckstrin-like domain